MGYYDLPALINYILDTTGNESLFYIGHSMGCTVAFILATLKPQYCSKIKAMAALGPAAYLQNIRSPLVRYCSHVFQPFVNKSWNFQFILRYFFNRKLQITLNGLFGK
jgi:lysosomal acid lipase/cholesteryl ester hydrolase